MTIAPSTAAAAYQAIAKIGAESAATGASANVGTDFTQFLSQAMNSAVSTMKQGEQVAATQVTGQADVVNVVNAVNTAELTLDTVVAVRDKVISAYQNIMQMPI
ncbi:MAG TPA: flagellar hook-basal body complex protein FliE [Rhizomicrobium sp.]|nr:flagellar hook-basal body complex protein FliE [Rhizomicrobium sp.]